MSDIVRPGALGCVLNVTVASVSTKPADPGTFLCLALQEAAPGQQRLVVVSISPQSRASLAARFRLDPTDTARKLTSFFKKIGRHRTLSERGRLVPGLLPPPEAHVTHPELNSRGTLPSVTSA
jgi:hypothetical protein